VTGFVGAVQFLTRVPVRTSTAPTLGATVPWFPVVGGLIGASIGALVAVLAEWVPMSVAAAAGVLIGVLLTGAFHEDGLADVADAFAGGWTREERLRILTDPLHGSYGVAALTGSIVLRVVCVAALSPATAFAGLVAAHSLGRAAAVGTMAGAPAAKPEGLGADSTRTLRAGPAAAGVAAGTGIAALACGWWAIPLVAVVALGAVATAALAVRKIGGVNGDVLGAIEQVGEMLVLVVITGLAARHRLWWV
jgi:adenosylcobinamide-GDP ribazoletransferase